MMAKITKGRDFGGAVRYVTQDKKEAKILDSKGVLTTDKQSIINSFRLQNQLRPDVKVMVGHISLDFSVEDVDRMSDDFMVKIAWEYMQRMNILNTQFTTLAPASETGNNIFIPALQIRLKIVTFASASK